MMSLGGSDKNTSIMETRDGILWLGGSGILHALRDGEWQIYSAPDVPIPRQRLRLFEASNGDLWMAALGGEGARVDRSNRWMSYEGLIYQCETPNGLQWFLSADGGVVRHDGTTWVRYGVEDGLIDAALAITSTREDVLWAASSHDSIAATARFDGKKWSRQTHPELSWGVDHRAVYEASDGAVWFGAAVDLIPEWGHLGGVLKFDGKAWTHYRPPEAPIFVYGIEQTADGRLWFGGQGLRVFDGQTRATTVEPKELATFWSDMIYTAPDGNLWIATRSHGIFHYNGENWERYDVRQGLAANRIRGIAKGSDGSIWAASHQGISRFLSLPSGSHTLEVRARDRDFNLDPTPASFQFKVVP